jgi:hypothetical protein
VCDGMVEDVASVFFKIATMEFVWKDWQDSVHKWEFDKLRKAIMHQCLSLYLWFTVNFTWFLKLCMEIQFLKCLF